MLRALLPAAMPEFLAFYEFYSFSMWIAGNATKCWQRTTCDKCPWLHEISFDFPVRGCHWRNWSCKKSELAQILHTKAGPDNMAKWKLLWNVWTTNSVCSCNSKNHSRRFDAWAGREDSHRDIDTITPKMALSAPQYWLPESARPSDGLTESDWKKKKI